MSFADVSDVAQINQLTKRHFLLLAATALYFIRIDTWYKSFILDMVILFIGVLLIA